MIAALTSVKELAISEEEARNLSDAAQQVAKQYQYFLTDKQLAWVNLAFVSANVYGTRFIAFGVRHASERRAKIAPSQNPAPAAPAAAPPPVNGHAMNLTPDFMTAPPEGEFIP